MSDGRVSYLCCWLNLHRHFLPVGGEWGEDRAESRLSADTEGRCYSSWGSRGAEPRGQGPDRGRGDRGRKGGSWVGARTGWADGGNRAGLGRKRAESGLGSVVYGYSLRMMRMPRMKRTPAMVRPPIRRDW